MNPAGQTPVMADPDKKLLLVDSMAICEYFEETVEKSSMISGTAANRAEIRRLVSWFATQFYGDIVAPLLPEWMIKRLVPSSTLDARALRVAQKRALPHPNYPYHMQLSDKD